MRLRERIQAGLKSFAFSAYGGQIGGSSDPWGWGWIGRVLPGSQYDYRREAGLLWENSTIAACLRWLGDTWSEAPWVLQEKGADGKWIPVADAWADAFLNDPCQYYDAATLWNGTVTSVKVAGDSYWYKERSAAGLLTGVVYVPHWQMSPRWGNKGSYIDYYEYRRDGKPVPVKVEDVVHYRYGIDPIAVRHGLRYLDAVLREVCGINESATYWAAMLRNRGVPGAVLSPATEADELDKDTRDFIRSNWRETVGGENVGGPFISSKPLKVDTVTFPPKQMDVSAVREPSQAAICSAFGVDPMVLGLPSANKTYSNYDAAQAGSYHMCLMPMHRQMGQQQDRQLLPELLGANPTNRRLGWDYRQVGYLQEAFNELAKPLTDAAGGAFLTRNEARARAGYEPIADPEYDKLYEPPAKLPGAAPGQTEEMARAARKAIYGERLWQGFSGQQGRVEA